MAHLTRAAALVAALMAMAGPAEADDFAALAAGLAPGEWKALPGTRLDAVFPARESHPAWGAMGPAAVTAAWGGAAFDPRRNVLMVTGGGGNHYGGNEVYVFRLSTQTWERATEPSPLACSGGRCRVDDGSEAPLAAHVHDGLAVLPDGRLFKWGGGVFGEGGATDAHAYLWDPAGRRWQRRAAAPHTPQAPSAEADPASGAVYATYENGLQVYDAAADRWKVLGGDDDQEAGAAAALDPTARRLVQVGSPAAPLVGYDLTPGTRRLPLPVHGDTGFAQLGRPGIAFEPKSRRFVIWGGGREVWTVDADTWAAIRLGNPRGPAPVRERPEGGDRTVGISGRWAYVPAYGVFIGLVNADDDVWIYKLPPPGAVENAAADQCGADLCVGPGWRYAVPSAAALAAQPGQSVALAPGDYLDCAVWRATVTIRGIRAADGRRPHVRERTCDGKAIWVVKGDETTIEGIEFSGATASDGNGAAIRHEGRKLMVRDSLIHHNQMGILTAHGERMELELHDNEIHSQFSTGPLAHNVYAGRIARFVAVGNYVHDGFRGHHLKTVAADNLIAFNRLDDRGGTASYQIDAWGCSRTVVIGNMLAKGANPENWSFISLSPRDPCPEGRTHGALVAFNTALVEAGQEMGRLVANTFGTEVEIRDNVAIGLAGLVAAGRAKEAGNWLMPNREAAGLDADLRPQVRSPLLGRAVSSGPGPEREVGAPLGTVARPHAGDPGAFAGPAAGAKPKTG